MKASQINNQSLSNSGTSQSDQSNQKNKQYVSYADAYQPPQNEPQKAVNTDSSQANESQGKTDNQKKQIHSIDDFKKNMVSKNTVKAQDQNDKHQEDSKKAPSLDETSKISKPDPKVTTNKIDQNLSSNNQRQNRNSAKTANSTPPSQNPSVLTSQNKDEGSANDNQAPKDSGKEEMLRNQNIFELLGVKSGKPEEREHFLDEVQKVIWEDFLNNDLRNNITTLEMKEVESILGQEDKSYVKKHEAVVDYLSKLLPNLEDIMLEKALFLKADMVKERIAGMKELYGDRPDILAKIERAENFMHRYRWKSVAKVLNSIE